MFNTFPIFSCKMQIFVQQSISSLSVIYRPWSLGSDPWPQGQHRQQISTNHATDGRNPAPVDMVNIP